MNKMPIKLENNPIKKAISSANLKSKLTEVKSDVKSSLSSVLSISGNSSNDLTKSPWVFPSKSYRLILSYNILIYLKGNINK